MIELDLSMDDHYLSRKIKIKKSFFVRIFLLVMLMVENKNIDDND
jgi:hypothetical protein